MTMYQIIIFCYDFVERDLLEWLAGLEPVQDVYDNERRDQGDRAESDDESSDEDESDEEEEIAHSVPFKCIGARAFFKDFPVGGGIF
jgi:hypothetical protein